ncbi:MAG: Hsp33 family molecular chaperone HslO [Clostridia bacterium]|nr:Hsp33 family molecular chaperone HslO [Clostridia bacterium]
MANTEKATILRGMTHDGSARILVINSRKIVNDMIGFHRTSPTATAALGRMVTASSMIGTMLPEEGDSVTISISGDGEAGKLIAVGDYYGNVKGYIQNPLANPPKKPNGKLDVGAAIGQGTISFVKSVGDGEPQIGTIELVSGEIAEDIATYFAKSEQIPTVLSLGVLVDTDYSCLAAGGVLIQLMPFPDESTVDLIERNAADLVNISRHFNAGLDNKAIADIAMRDIPYDIFDTLEVEYKCDCGHDRMKKKIQSLGKKEILTMLDEQEAEGKERALTAICRFCNTEYTYSEKELLK